MCGWRPVLSIDNCRSIKPWHERNFDHPFLLGDITDKGFQHEIVARLRKSGIQTDALLCGPPCEAWSPAGKRAAGDGRVQVAAACADLACLLPIKMICIENVPGMANSKRNPCLHEYILPKLKKHGFKWITLCKSDAARCGVPNRRRRLFVVATRYPSGDRLKQHMAYLKTAPETTMAMALPELRHKHVRFWPCHNSAAVVSADRHPAPPTRKSSLTAVDISSYKERPQDSAPISVSVTLTMEQRMKIAGLPEHMVLPPPDYVCRFPECCGERGWLIPQLGVALGNMLSPPQGAEVLRHVGLPALQKEDRNLEHLSRALMCTTKENALAYRDAPIPNVAQRLHERMGHASRERMINAIKQGYTLGLKVSVEEVQNLPFCRTCAAAHSTSGPRSHKGIKRPPIIHLNERVHTDGIERRHKSRQGNSRTQLFLDEWSRWIHCEHMDRKSEASFKKMLHAAEAALHMLSRTSAECLGSPELAKGRPVEKYVTDNEPGLIARDQKTLLLKRLIDIQRTVPGASTHASLVERANRSIIDLARAQLVHAQMEGKWWQYSF